MYIYTSSSTEITLHWLVMKQSTIAAPITKPSSGAYKNKEMREMCEYFIVNASTK